MTAPYWRNLPSELREQVLDAEIENVHTLAREIALDNLDDMSPEDLAEIALTLAGEEGTPAQVRAWVKQHTTED